MYKVKVFEGGSPRQLSKKCQRKTEWFSPLLVRERGVSGAGSVGAACCQARSLQLFDAVDKIITRKTEWFSLARPRGSPLPGLA